MPNQQTKNIQTVRFQGGRRKVEMGKSFKTGDRVKFKEDDTEIWTSLRGKEGIIQSIKKGDPHKFFILLDDPEIHSQREDKCWRTTEDMLKFLPPKRERERQFDPLLGTPKRKLGKRWISKKEIE